MENEKGELALDKAMDLSYSRLRNELINNKPLEYRLPHESTQRITRPLKRLQDVNCTEQSSGTLTSKHYARPVVPTVCSVVPKGSATNSQWLRG